MNIHIVLPTIVLITVLFFCYHAVKGMLALDKMSLRLSEKPANDRKHETDTEIHPRHETDVAYILRSKESVRDFLATKGGVPEAEIIEFIGTLPRNTFRRYSNSEARVLLKNIRRTTKRSLDT